MPQNLLNLFINSLPNYATAWAECENLGGGLPVKGSKISSYAYSFFPFVIPGSSHSPTTQVGTLIPILLDPQLLSLLLPFGHFPLLGKTR